MSNNARCYVVGLSVLCLLFGLGCNPPELSWQHGPAAPKLISQNQRSAVVARVSMTEGMPSSGINSTEVANSVAGELMTRGYEVTVLREEAIAGWKVKEEVKATSGDKPTATIKREARGGDEDMARRFEAAAKAKARLLFECSTQASQKAVHHSVYNPIPYAPGLSSTEWKNEIRQITLTVSDVTKRSVLATVTVRYKKAIDNIQAAVKDVFLGLDQVRLGRPPATVTLSGKPGKRTIKE